MSGYAELWRLAIPESLVVLTGFVVLLVDLGLLRRASLRTRFSVGAAIACAGCAVAIGRLWLAPLTANVFDGMLVANPLTGMVQMVLLLLTMLTVLVSIEATFTVHVGEYLLLILLATSGMMFLVGSQNILLIFISLEMLSLCLYALAAFDKRSVQSAEAALKYFLFGGTSAAFLLFGMSLLYGLSGSINLVGIAAAVSGEHLDPLAAVAMVAVVIGFGFKIAAVPFHLWAPDAYQGAPAPSAAFIASGSKVASFFIFAQVLAVGFAGAAGSGAWHAWRPGWTAVLAIVAALSMLLGNLAAIVQTSVRRLLAYSAIAHAGYMLLAVMARGERGVAALLYYVFTYALTTVGAFAVVAVVEQATGGDTLEHFKGLSRRAPLVSASMMVFLLSLAGIPPLAGFFGKFYVFAAALSSAPQGGLLWLVVLAIGMSAVSLYYYLQVLKRIFVSDGAGGEIRVAPVMQLVLGLTALAVVVLGCMPNLLLGWIERAVQTIS